MPRKNIYLSDEIFSILLKSTKEKNKNVSEYLSQLIADDAVRKSENISEMRDDMGRLRRAENANGKNITAMMDMMNTFFKVFAVGDNEKIFFSVDESPHIWTRKGLEDAEAKLQMAMYNRKRHR